MKAYKGGYKTDIHKTWRECADQIKLVRFDILTVVNIETTIVLDGTPYSLV